MTQNATTEPMTGVVMQPGTPTCSGCGKPFAAHLGLQGTCQRLVQAQLDIIQLEEVAIWARELRFQLHAARTDIFHWVQLAEKQQRELPNVDYLPCGPTDAGIRESLRLLDDIDQVFRKEPKAGT